MTVKLTPLTGDEKYVWVAFIEKNDGMCFAGVFSDEKMAIDVSRTGRYVQIQECVFDPSESYTGYSLFEVYIDRDGYVDGIETIKGFNGSFGEDELGITEIYTTGFADVHVWAENKRDAVHLAQKVREEAIASGDWPEQDDDEQEGEDE